MTTYFADTFYFLALLNEDDEAHARVADFMREFAGRMWSWGVVQKPGAC
jgi:hypothetical protein